MFRILIVLLFIASPITSRAAVIFSEIAWMGTAENANDEWIELYNHDSGGVNVDGWTISDGVSLDITLSGTIPGRTIVLLERTDDSTVPSITAFQIYTGALANDGRTLTLKRADGTTEDRAVGGENWANIGGDNTTKETAQGTMTGWVTGTPTPGAPNVEHGSNTNTDTTDEEEENESTNGTVKGTSTSWQKNGDGVSISLTMPQTELRLDIEANEIAYVNAPVTLTALPSGIGKHITDSLVYSWNFGDAYTSEGKTTTHTFQYPGEYVVVLRGVYARHDTVIQKVITVLPVTVTLSRTPQNDIVLTNTASHAIDLSGYVLKGGKTLTFPQHSLLLSGKSLTIHRDRVEGLVQSMVALYDGEKEMVASESFTYSKITQVSSPVPSLVPPKTTASLRASKPAIQKTAERDVHASSTAAASTSPILSNLPPTIPLYNVAEAAGASIDAPSLLGNKLPYIGLVVVLLLSILALYTRKSNSDLS